MTVTTTVWGVYAGPTVTQQSTTIATAIGAGGVFVAGNAGGSTTTTQVPKGPYCSTLTMRGQPIPTPAQGRCGTILIVPPSGATGLGVKRTTLMGFVLFHAFLGALLI